MNSEIYTDHAIISWVLDHCQVLRLGLADDDGTYVVPVNYGYEEDENGHYILYIHGTNQGRKGRLLKKSPVISFETDGGHEGLTYTPPAPGAFAPAFRSVIGQGQVEAITNSQAKRHALRTLIHHYVRDIPAIIHAEDLKNVPVWVIKVDQITAKIHHPTAEWQKLLGLKQPILRGYHYNEAGDLIEVDPDVTKAEDDDHHNNGDVDGSTGASQK